MMNFIDDVINEYREQSREKKTTTELTAGSIASPHKNKRLPNGRFMSKSQWEAYERGVSIEEIVKMAETAASEKKQQSGETSATNKGKTKTSRGKSRSTADDRKTQRKANESTKSNANTSNGISVQFQSPSASSSPHHRQQQQQAGLSGLNSAIKIINGQPVIQARLERVQMPDGSQMTVAVLPTDVNILSAANIVMPQWLRQQGRQEHTPTRLLAPSPSPIQLPAPSSVVTIHPASGNGSSGSVGRADLPVFPNTPNGRFTFQLTSEDERNMVELANHISRYRAMPQRTSEDEKTLAVLEERRTAILQQAASKHITAMTSSKANHVETLDKLPLPCQPKIVQIGGMQYLAVRKDTVIQPGSIITVPCIGSTPGSSESNPHLEQAQAPLLSSVSESIPLPTENLVLDRRPTTERLQERIEQCVRFDQENVLRPNCTTPFRNVTDAMRRLISYHTYNQVDIDQGLLTTVDNDLRTFVSRCRAESKKLYKRFFDAFDNVETSSGSLDRIMMNSVILEEERRSFEEERATAARSPEHYAEELRRRRNSEESTDGSNQLEVSDNLVPTVSIFHHSCSPSAPTEQYSNAPALSNASGESTSSSDFTSPAAKLPRLVSPEQSSMTRKVDGRNGHRVQTDHPCNEGGPVKVVLRNGLSSSSDTGQMEDSGDGNEAVTTTKMESGRFTTILPADYYNERTLRVPPLKIRLQYDDPPNTNDSPSRLDDNTTELESTATSGNYDQASTATSPGDSGLDDENDLCDDGQTERHKDDYIPRLKLFRPSGMSSNGYSTNTRWIKVESDDNEQSS